MIFTDAKGARPDKFRARQQRRKANRLAKATGGIEFMSNAGRSSTRPVNLAELERTAKAEMGLRIRLAGMNTVESRKAKRKLNDRWYDRNTATVQGAWSEAEANTHNPMQVIK